MNEWVSSICEFLLLLAFVLGLVRFFKGPSRLDRILAFDLMALCIVGVVVIFSMQTETPYYLEVVLIFTLLGFVTTLALMDALFKRSGES